MSRMAVSTSFPNADTVSTIVVPRLLGQMGSQSAQASGSGRLPSRASLDSRRQMFPHVKASLHVSGATSTPLNIPPATIVRGQLVDESATDACRKSSPTLSTRAPQKGDIHPSRPVHPSAP
jgi:hypothetical protein